MKTHFGRAFTGHALEDECPCPKAPCGLVGGDTETVYCDQHSVMAAKTIRQQHEQYDCPAYKPHEVRWSIHRFSSGVSMDFTCSAPEGAPCRLHCPENCESWSLTDHEHELVDSGECMLLPFLDNIDQDDAIDAYTGEGHPLSDGPVELNYVEEYVEWRYSDSEALAEASINSISTDNEPKETP